MMMRNCTWLIVVALMSVGAAGATQLQPPPRPFPEPTPRPGTTPPSPAPTTTPPATPAPAPPQGAAPDETTLGVPIYPSAEYIGSYDAGRGQRFYLFGVTLPYADAVTYYRSTLRSRGDELYASPPTHQFELARFNDDVMAFPPSVTIKDYTFGGSGGFPNPKPGAEPARFPTVIQIVPIPPQ